MNTLLLALFACAPEGALTPDVDRPPVQVGEEVPARPDPFAPPPGEPSSLTDVSHDLDAVLEHGFLADACDEWRADPTDHDLELRCGKALFFDGTFATAGVPAPLVEFLVASFPDEIGPGFEKLGLVRDPRSDEALPIGMARGAPMGDVETYAFTCASCHFARLPDGRYAVGAPNHDYAYGHQNLAIALLPMVMAGQTVDAEGKDVVQPLVDRLEADPALRIAFMVNLLPMISAQVPAFPIDAQRAYAMWHSGTMDFFIAPLPLDDGVHTISKIPPLWELPGAEEQADAGMPHAMLGWTGNTASLESFVRGFVSTGDGAADVWNDAAMAPLVAYVSSLRRVEAPPADELAISRGEAVFHDAGCAECHGGPRGSGVRVYAFDEVGTDDALMYWLDPDLTGEPCCGFDAGDDPLTQGIKSPRLVGLWAQGRFLHNGSVDSLESLVCLDPRDGVVEPAWGDGGHTFGCERSTRDREDLLAFLRAH